MKNAERLAKVLHGWEIVKIKLDLEGRVRTFIRTNLFRKYLNYSERSRASISPASMQLALTQDTQDVASGYGCLLDLIQQAGQFEATRRFKGLCGAL